MKFCLSDMGTFLSSFSNLLTTILVAWEKKRKRNLIKNPFQAFSACLVTEFQDHVIKAQVVLIVYCRGSRVGRGRRREG